MLTPEQKLLLESLIDSSSLADVLDTLTEIAYGKAQHIAETWQDESLAKVWDKAAQRIESVACHTVVCTVSRR